MMVVVSHWTGFKTWWFSGAIGVQLFFVLSGFLITSILLDAKIHMTQDWTGRRRVLKSFFIRRFLRIVPLYYATLLIMYLVGIDAVRDTLIWHLLYVSNVFFALRGSFYAQVSHFWTLSVEEQFYVVWPFIVLFMPVHKIIRAIVLLVLIAPLFRLFATDSGLNSVAVEVLPFASFDALGLGSVLAFLNTSNDLSSEESNSTEKLIKGHLIKWFFLIIISAGFFLWALEGGIAQIRRTFLAPSLAAIVYLVLSNRWPWLIRLLSATPIVWIGKVSYSIYVLHFFVPHVLMIIARRAGVEIIEMLNDWQFFVVCLVVQFVASAISWRYYERPINSLKRHYPYVQRFQ